MRAYFLSLLAYIFISSAVFADSISKYISEADFGFRSDVGIILLDKDSKKVLYNKGQNTPLNPASILKLLTLGASIQALGEDYQFETVLYKDCDNNIYLKLGGDFLLTKKDLESLVYVLKNEKINNVYIDDSIFLKEDYPSSWLDEDKWPNQGYITPYMVDNNRVKIAINRSSLATKVDIIQNDDYKMPIINELKLGDIQNIKIERNFGDESSIINLKGTVSKDEIIEIPVLKPEINFKVKLKEALEKYNVVYSGQIANAAIQDDFIKISSVSHGISDVFPLILHNSNNLASETVFRVAASKYFNKTANLDDSIMMFNEFYGSYLSKNEKIADASGVSRQNLLSVKTISNILCEICNKTNILSYMQNANQGTMKDRLYFLQDNLKVKTGTMKNLSSIAGVLKTRNNSNIMFVSIVQNSSKRKSLLKNFENNLIGLIYKKY